MKIRATLFIACLLLAACGQRGDLYLPDEPRAVVVTAGGSEPADDEDPEETEGQPQGTGNAAGN